MLMPSIFGETLFDDLFDDFTTLPANRPVRYAAANPSVMRTDIKEQKDGYELERYSGSCSRSFYVGEDITQEDIKAKFENGILKIGVPKKDAKPKVPENKFITIEG